MAYNGRRPWRNENLTIEAGDLIIRAKLVDVKYDQLGSHDVTHPLVGYAYLVKQAQYDEYEAHCTRLEALAKAIEDCKTKGYLDDYMDKEEFLTMLPNVYTIEQQLMDQLEYGIEQGALEKALDTTKKALQSGIDVVTVAMITDLPIDEVEKLR